MAYEKGAVVELMTSVKDIDDGNEVVFQLWREGQDPNAGIPVGVTRGIVKNGTAKVQCRLVFPDSIADDPDPKFFFTVHSAWCPSRRVRYKKI